MNDTEFELRLHKELPQRIAAPDAPPSLFAYVAHLGIDEPVVAVERHPIEDRRGELGRRLGSPSRASQSRLGRSGQVLLSLAAALGVIALLAASLMWRSSHQPVALEQGSPSGSSVATTASAGASASARATAGPPASATAPTAQLSPAAPWTGPAANASDMHRIDVNSGWAMLLDASFTLYLTDDGGQTWQLRTPRDLLGVKEPQPNQGRVFGAGMLTFSDASHGWFLYEHELGADAASHVLFWTTDGGRSWMQSPVPAPSSARPSWIARVDDRTFLVGFLDRTGNNSQIWTTADGGSTWSHVDQLRAAASGFPDYQPQFSTPLDGWGLSTFGDPLGLRVTHTVDGGKTWKTALLPYAYGNAFGGGAELPVMVGGELVVTGDIETGSGADGLDKLAVVEWTSTDGGANWQQEHELQLGDVLWVGDAPGLSVYRPRNGTTIELVDGYAGRVVATMDTSSFCQPDQGAYVSGVSATSTKDLWATCLRDSAGTGTAHYYLYGTSDGGKTWQPLMGKP